MAPEPQSGWLLYLLTTVVRVKQNLSARRHSRSFLQAFLSWSGNVLSHITWSFWASRVPLVVKNLPANAGDLRAVGSIPGLGGSPGGGHRNPLQSPCLERPMDRGAWWATVHEVAKSWT